MLFKNINDLGPVLLMISERITELIKNAMVVEKDTAR